MLKKIFLFLAILGLAVFTYRGSLHSPYYNDEYERVFTNPGEAEFLGFIQANPFDHFYRPIEQLVLAVIQSIWGWDTFPIRLLNLFLHSALAFLIFRIARLSNVSVTPALAGVAFVVFCELSVYSITSNNTLSQVLSTFFSALALWFLYLSETEAKKQLTYSLSLLFFLLALLSKETSVYLLFAIPFLLFILRRQQNKRGKYYRIVVSFIPFIIVFILFWSVRIFSGAASPRFGEGFYSYHLGFNVLKNIFVFTAQSILPFSTVSVMRLWHVRELIPLGFMTLLTVLFVWLIIYGCWKSERKNTALVLAAMVFLSWVPVLLLRHIFETYIYSSLPFLTALFVIATEYYWNLSKKNFRFSAFAGIVFSIALTVNFLAVDQKASLMAKEGRRAEILLPQIISLAKQIPLNECLYLINQDHEFTYTRYIDQTFTVCNHSDSLIKFYSERPDIFFATGDSGWCAELAKVHPGVAYTCDPEKLRLYPLQPNFTGRN